MLSIASTSCMYVPLWVTVKEFGYVWDCAEATLYHHKNGKNVAQ